MPPTAIEQMRRELELVQGVGEVERDWKCPPLGDHVNPARAGQQANRRPELGGRHHLLEVAELVDRLADELVEHAARRVAAVGAIPAHLRDALAIARRARHEVTRGRPAASP